MHEKPIHRIPAGLAAAVLLLSVTAILPASAGTLTVNTTDTILDGRCDSHCSLSDAVIVANMHAGPDRITFSIPGEGPYIIYLGTAEGRVFMEPNVWDDETEIDATTQPGYPVYVHGMGEAGWGLIIHSNRNTVRGLGFLGFNEAGLAIEGDGNFIDRVVAGDYLGEGLIPAPIGNHVGILINGEDNTLRGVSVANNHHGIEIFGRGQHIQDSQIGFLSGSSSRRGNETGLLAYAVASGNIIERNSVMGNTEIGINVWSSGNILTGNKIGLDSSGLHSVGNEIGIRLSVLGGNRVGGLESSEGNIIVGNGIGIDIFSPGNQVLNNRIGVDYSGRAIPNETGVRLGYGSDGTLLGSEWTGALNIIAHNSGAGVITDHSIRTRIVGNSVFSNAGDGVRVEVAESSPPPEGLQVTLHRNSIYNNGGLGIHIPDPSVNGNLAPPVLASVEAGAVSGTTCPGCIVELFLAAPDPSGAGEGETFLMEATAGSDGSFRAELAGLHSCDVITATSTDEVGNTSEFSRNAGVGLCARIPPLAAIAWIISTAGGGSAFTVIIRRRPLTLRTLPWIVVGGLLGAGVGVILMRLPFVQVNWGQSGAQPAPTKCPEGQGCFVTTRKYTNEVLSDTSDLSATWFPSTTTPPIDVTPAPVPEAMAREDANCRLGPSTEYNVATYLVQGQVVPITGRLAQSGWWQVQPTDIQVPCWIAEDVAEPYGDMSAVPIVIPPALPTPTPTEEPVSPAQGCMCWTGNVCLYTEPCRAQCTPCPPG